MRVHGYSLQQGDRGGPGCDYHKPGKLPPRKPLTGRRRDCLQTYGQQRDRSSSHVVLKQRMSLPNSTKPPKTREKHFRCLQKAISELLFFGTSLDALILSHTLKGASSMLRIVKGAYLTDDGNLALGARNPGTVQKTLPKACDVAITERNSRARIVKIVTLRETTDSLR